MISLQETTPLEIQLQLLLLEAPSLEKLEATAESATPPPSGSSLGAPPPAGQRLKFYLMLLQLLLLFVRLTLSPKRRRYLPRRQSPRLENRVVGGGALLPLKLLQPTSAR